MSNVKNMCPITKNTTKYICKFKYLIIQMKNEYLECIMQMQNDTADTQSITCLIKWLIPYIENLITSRCF